MPAYRTSPLFDEVDRLVLDYSVGMTRTPADVPDELLSTLETHFEGDQIVELTQLIAIENMRGRFGIGLDIGSAGLGEGMVCAGPVTLDRHKTPSISK